MNILFLTPYPTDEAPSQRFRFEQYFNSLTEPGHHFTMQSFLDKKSWAVLYQPGHTLIKGWGITKGFLRRFKVLLQLSHYDLVFIHREASPIGPPILEWVIAKVWKKKIIYDFDDAIWIPNTSAENQLAAKLKWHSKVASICRWSHKISCGNAFLAKWAGQYNSNVSIMPTTLDTEHVHNTIKTHHPGPVTIGWTGTHSTLKYLKLIEPVLQKLAQKHPGVNFIIISNQPPQLALGNRLRFIPWRKETEIQDLLKLDIGIMPLTADAWSEGKCGFKALQYMSLAIPTVASPVGVNQTIIESGKNGFLASSEDAWLKTLSSLIEDPKLRASIGVQARAKVEERFSVLANRANFLALFE